jgi:hypothetical protein
LRKSSWNGWHVEAIVERPRDPIDPIDGLVVFVVVACLGVAFSPLIASLALLAGMVRP